MAQRIFSKLPPFQLSQTKNPMPIPPDNISPATMTIQATPILKRKPVMMCGKAKGSRILVMYFDFEKPNALATLMWSCGIEATPNAVFISVGHKDVMKMTKTVAEGADSNAKSPNGNQASGETGRKIWTIGFIKRIPILLEPIKIPMGMATKLPRPKPINTRPIELNN